MQGLLKFEHELVLFIEFLQESACSNTMLLYCISNITVKILLVKNRDRKQQQYHCTVKIKSALHMLCLDYPAKVHKIFKVF